MLKEYVLKKVRDGKEKLYVLNNEVERLGGRLLGERMLGELEDGIDDGGGVGE